MIGYLRDAVITAVKILGVLVVLVLATGQL